MEMDGVFLHGWERGGRYLGLCEMMKAENREWEERGIRD